MTYYERLQGGRSRWNQCSLASQLFNPTICHRVGKIMVKLGYTSDSIWRNQSSFLKGRDKIEAFLTSKCSSFEFLLSEAQP